MGTETKTKGMDDKLDDLNIDYFVRTVTQYVKALSSQKL